MLPHTPRIEPLVVNDQWQGICWYRKSFRVDKRFSDHLILIEFEAAMQVATVWLNGVEITRHYGGYLPFMIDITGSTRFGGENVLAVRLDNRDDPSVPPGKPLRELDFCMYGGLYRNVKLHIVDRLHITDAVAAGQPAGGGVFVRYPLVSQEKAKISVRTHVRNSDGVARHFQLVQQLYDAHHKLAAEASLTVTLGSFQDKHIDQLMDVAHPRLWHPDTPNLYKLTTLLRDGSRITDSLVTVIGIREISFDKDKGFMINGESFFLRGTNRHQEYPYIGYALSDQAQRRDVIKIKEAGFDFVRSSHYPQSSAFLSACDEYGLLVMDAIPGWQFFGDSLFQRRSYQDCRDMIRRDRNHPCIVSWEVSLNESAMSKKFMQEAHRIAHEEHPGDQCYSSGWMDETYDIFIPARQHAAPPDYWKNYDKKPLLIAEYGDWEYYAQNAGFNQKEFKDLAPEERSSRQLRGAGEKRLLQQCLNFQEAYNDNLASRAAGCANWLMFDYNRGYADDIESSGIMDIFRLPKFAYYFYASQRPIDAANAFAAPMLFIANQGAADSTPLIKVFSNCPQIKVLADSFEISPEPPDPYSNLLEFPPRTFDISRHLSGEIQAIGYSDGQEVARKKLARFSSPQKIAIFADLEGLAPMPGSKDVFFVRAAVVDHWDRPVLAAVDTIRFSVSGPGRLIGGNPIAAEAGIASIIVETNGNKGRIKIAATGRGLRESVTEINIR